jgi:hypothetical protein
VIRSQRSPYGTSLPGAGAVHHIRLGLPAIFATGPLLLRKRTCSRHRRRFQTCLEEIPSGLISWLFDHLVGERYQHRRHVEAERLGGLEIDDELELRWLLDWNLRRVLAFQDFVDEIDRAPTSAGAIPLISPCKCDPKATVRL